MRTSTIRTAAAPIPVTVNDVLISAADIAREVQNHTGPSPREAWSEATRALVVRELLSQRARSLGLTAEPVSEGGLRETEEEALIRVLLATEVRTPKADDATCRRYYMANPAKFRRADLFEPLHILFKASREDVSAYTQAIERAKAVLVRVTTDPDSFENLARALSDCPSASEGGRLGQIARGDTTPEFEAAMLSLAPGQICPQPVHTRYGVHVLRLDRTVTGEVPPYDQVKDRIAAWLEESSFRRAIAQYIALLAGAARITGFDMPGAGSPLVQ